VGVDDQPRWACPLGYLRPMTAKKMTREEEFEFYAQPESQEPQGSPRRRRSKLAELVPVRFPPEMLKEIRQRAGEANRSVSSWISQAVEHELREGIR
jgi:predicted HicB family RNase H-like nuclease